MLLNLCFSKLLMDSLRLALEANFWVAKDNSGAGKAAPVPSNLSRPYPRSVVPGRWWNREGTQNILPSPAFTPLDHDRGRLVFPLQQSHFVLPTLPPAGHTGPCLPTLNSRGEVQRSRWHLVPRLEVCGIKMSLSGVLHQGTSFSLDEKSYEECLFIWLMLARK